MKLLANENFPLTSVRILKEKGNDITAIGIDHSGIEDEKVIQIALDEERLILTFDRDYGELIFRRHYQPEAGVIYLRLTDFSLQSPAYLIDEIIRNSEIELGRRLTVIDSNGIRQRKY